MSIRLDIGAREMTNWSEWERQQVKEREKRGENAKRLPLNISISLE